MKKATLFLIVYLFKIHLTFSQCPEIEEYSFLQLELTTQEQVDSFVINFPNCKIITGIVKINGGNSITNLSALKNIESINARLDIEDNFKLTNLEGLNNLKKTGSLYINNNTSLINLKGLEKLQSIEGKFTVTRNDALIDLEGLENLESVVNNVNIGVGPFASYSYYNTDIGNNSLQSLKGLEALLTIGGSLQIGEHASMKSINSLQNLQLINGSLIITQNDSLQKLSALQNLQSIGNSFIIKENPSLIEFDGLQSLTSINKALIIEDNQSLGSLSGLENLTKVVLSDLSILNCNSLTNLSGLNNLNTIGLDLNIIDNDKLTNLAGLENLSKVRIVDIRNNPSLSSLSGLFNLKSVSRLWIEKSAALNNLIGLEKLEHVGSLWLKNLTGLTNFSGLKKLKSVSSLIIENNSSLTDLTGLEQLKLIKSLIIDDNTKLADLNALNNVTSISSNLEIRGNKILDNCNIQPICKLLTSYGSRVIENNGDNCNSVDAILRNCTESATIKTQFFFDKNQNGVFEIDEPFVSFGSVNISSGKKILLSNPLTGGSSNSIAPGEYVININENSLENWNLTTNTLSYTISLTEGECKELIFGLYPKQNISKTEPAINAPLVLCQDTIPFFVSGKNDGTTTVEGILWFQIDSISLATQFVDEPDTLIPPYRYGWFFNNLGPSHLVTKQINLVIAQREPLPTFESYIEFEDENGSQQSNTTVFQTKYGCGFANGTIGKTIQPNRNCGFILFDEPIIYTTRFLSSSEDLVSKITVIEHVDSTLDLSTFRFVNSSFLENLTISINEFNEIIFKFENISSPISEQDRYGYISYSIKAKQDIPEYTFIQGPSSVYFDYSVPVRISSVKRALVSEINEEDCNCNPSRANVWCQDYDKDGLGNPNISFYSCLQPEGFIDNCSDPDDLVFVLYNSLDNMVNIYPNPTNGIFKIHLEDATFKQATLSMFNAQGQQVGQPINLKQNQHWLDYPELTNGVYYLTILVNDLIFRKKLVVVK